MQIVHYITELVGRTSSVRLNKIPQASRAVTQILVNLESMKRAASIKEMIGASMVEAAEEAGLIHPGKTILVKPTSGNTGIALFMMAAAKDYYLILTMPDTMSQERQAMLRIHGTQLKLTPGVQGMGEAIDCAEQILAQTPNVHTLQQLIANFPVIAPTYKLCYLWLLTKYR
ncbi:pyridoxal-phosphate dependent enzyme [Nostoc sp. CENA67]|uniref:Pyridoxal-phosphate dependent enzyme n=1 Tax=Amazonocrinis nigriterrae CENA67 TaxID=2794033 RepID=A0A8J7HRJ0_9NOST|nr:pyridoxal-phosphate dependent enzyme [Amazonocrinis nigriterrae CENA67]